MIDHIRSQVQEVFRDVFGDDEIILTDDMTANDIPEWDSMMHINLIIAIEQRFGVKFSLAEVSGLKAEDQNVGTFLQLVAGKVANSV